MVLKKGDKVRINPEFAKILRNSECKEPWATSLIQVADQVLEVAIEETDYSLTLSDWALVSFGPPVNWWIKVWRNTCAYSRFGRTSAPVVILATKRDDLKTANTRSEITQCAACGGPLKNPMPWIPSLKHCPKCEP